MNIFKSMKMPVNADGCLTPTDQLNEVISRIMADEKDWCHDQTSIWAFVGRLKHTLRIQRISSTTVQVDLAAHMKGKPGWLIQIGRFSPVYSGKSFCHVLCEAYFKTYGDTTDGLVEPESLSSL